MIPLTSHQRLSEGRREQWTRMWRRFNYFLSVFFRTCFFVVLGFISFQCLIFVLFGRFSFLNSFT